LSLIDGDDITQHNSGGFFFLKSPCSNVITPQVPKENHPSST
jgi:hypothetical protein